MPPDITDAGPRLKAMNDRLEELRTAADLADAEYRQEIDRLRLTDAEREAVQAAIDSFAGGADFNDERGWPATAQRLRQRAANLRELLKRMSGDGGK